MDLSEYSGRTALVTGGADGIGAMLARGLAGLGFQVGVLDIRKEAAETLAEAIGGEAFAIAADVSDRVSLQCAAEAVHARGGGLSLLWINAGVGVGASLLEGSARAVEWAYGVNVLGAIWTAQVFTPLLLETTGPRHVGVTASTASLRSPEPPLSLYGATKQGTFAVAEGLRGEFAIHGIGTTILCPGLLNTEIWDAARARPERFGGVRHMDPSIATRWQKAPSPEVMWPHIQRVLRAGGGYLTCNTDGDMQAITARRAAAIEESFIDL